MIAPRGFCEKDAKAMWYLASRIVKSSVGGLCGERGQEGGGSGDGLSRITNSTKVRSIGQENASEVPEAAVTSYVEEPREKYQPEGHQCWS